MPQTELLPVIPFAESVFVQWKSTNKQCIKSFTISVFTNNGIILIYKREGLIDYEQNVTNLHPCTDYVIELLTNDAIGQMQQEDKTETKTSSVNPSSIKNIEIYVTLPSVAINWEKPEYGSTCVDYYSLKLVSFIKASVEKWLPGE